MMKKIIIILLILISLPMSSIFFKMYITKNPIKKGYVGNGTYSVVQDSYDYYMNPLTKTVYRSRMGNWFSLSFSEVIGADGKTFENLGIDLGKDAKAIYFKDKAIYQLTKTSLIETRDIKDYDKYDLKIDGKYFFIEDNSLQEIPSKNPSELRFLGENFSKDQESIYYRTHSIYSFKEKGIRVEINREKIFSIDGEIYVFDMEKKQLFQVPNADFTSIQHLGGFFLGDNTSLFYRGKFLMKIDKKDELRGDFPYIEINGKMYELKDEKELIPVTIK